MKFFAALLILLIVSFLPPVSAGQVILSTPQSEYYFQTGTEAVIPLVIVSTYDHDVTGTLKQTRIPVDIARGGSSGASVQARQFSAFTEKRTASIPIGRSDAPADYLLTLAFSYDEGGGRTSALGGIGIHFLASKEDVPENHVTLTGTDTADPAEEAPPGGSPSAGNEGGEGTLDALQNAQMAQDAQALRNQIAIESNRSELREAELLGYILADPLFQSLDRTLTSAGFARNTTGISPVSNRSGTFLFTYSSGKQAAAIEGTVLETHVMFARETSDAPVPLPEALLSNGTYQDYTRRVAEKGFVRSTTRINVTPVGETVELTCAGPGNRVLHMNAGIRNGSVVVISGDSPEDPLVPLIPLLALISVLLLSAGIWYLAKTHPDLPPPETGEQEPEHRETSREIAGRLLDEAEQDAARGDLPAAYRKTGRAVRVFFSHEIGHGGELTRTELERLIASSSGDTDTIRWILNRSMAAGFAKDPPTYGEFREMIGHSRALFTGKSSGGMRPGPER